MPTPSKIAVILRDVIESDLSIFFEQQLDPIANHMAAFIRRDPNDREAFFKNWGKILADPTITVKTILFENQVAGHVMTFEDSGERDVSYWLGKEFWDKGIATAALAAFLDQIGTRPLFARVAQDNFASLRVLQKCGFKITDEGKYYSNARGEEIGEYILTRME